MLFSGRCRPQNDSRRRGPQQTTRRCAVGDDAGVFRMELAVISVTGPISCNEMMCCIFNLVLGSSGQGGLVWLPSGHSRPPVRRRYRTERSWILMGLRAHSILRPGGHEAARQCLLFTRKSDCGDGGTWRFGKQERV